MEISPNVCIIHIDKSMHCNACTCMHTHIVIYTQSGSYLAVHSTSWVITTYSYSMGI